MLARGCPEAQPAYVRPAGSGRTGRLHPANEILRKASAYFAQAELDRRFQAMIAFIDDHREAQGVEPIRKVLPIAPVDPPWTCHLHQHVYAGPGDMPTRAAHGEQHEPAEAGYLAGSPNRTKCRAAKRGKRC